MRYLMLCLVGASACMLSSCSSEARLRTTLSKGETMLASGRYEDAALSFRKALTYRPDSGPAHLGLGKALVRLHRPAEGCPILSRASDLLPNNVEAAVQFGECDLLLFVAQNGQVASVRDQLLSTADRLLRSDPQHPAGLRFKAFVAMADKKPQQAVDLLETALHRDPDAPDTQYSLIQAYLATDRIADAEALFRRALQKNKTFFPIYDALALYYTLKSPDPAALERTLKLKAENNPDQADPILELARFYAGRGRVPDVTATLGRMLDRPASFPAAYVKTGDFYASVGQFDKAADVYRQGMQKEPSSKLVLERRIAGLLARRNDYRGALEIAERIARENPKSVDCRELLAGLLADSGDPSNATRAQQMYAALVKEFPDNATYRQNLGRVNYLRADFAAALIALTEALRLNPSSVPTRRLLVQTAFAMGSYDRVLRSADEVLTLNPRDSEIRLTRAIALNRLGINGQARAELMRLVADTPDYVPAQLELALLDLAANRIDRAEAVFRRYYRPGLDDLRPLDGLGQVLVRRGKIDEAIRLLEKERGVSPYPSRIDSILGDVAQRVNRPKVAVAAFQRMVEATNSAFAWTRLSGAQLANGDAVAALASSRRAVEIDPRDAATQSALAAAAFAADDIRTSVTALTAALQIKPNDPGVQNNLAFGLAEQGENLVEAARLADSAVRAQPSNLLFADTQAWVALKRGNREAAVQSLESLVKKLPDNGTIRYHRAAALAAIGEDKLARAEFEQAIALGLAPRDRATATKFVVAAK